MKRRSSKRTLRSMMRRSLSSITSRRRRCIRSTLRCAPRRPMAKERRRNRRGDMTDKLPTSTLRVGLPSGSLQNATVELFAKAGYRVRIADRSVFPSFDDPQISSVLFRAQEISRYVCDDIVDCGLTGWDWVVENGSENDIVQI